MFASVPAISLILKFAVHSDNIKNEMVNIFELIR